MNNDSIVIQEFCRHKNRDNSRYVRRDQFTVESGYAMMLDLIAAHTVPTALFCASDAIAMARCGHCMRTITLYRRHFDLRL
ncbi:MAG: hypothetical protein ACLSA6_06285 [Holdemania massiliensis]